MEVYKVTQKQKDLLIGQTWDDVQFFNVVEDANNNLFVSIEQVQGCNKPEFQWLKDCELIPYNPKVFDFPI